MHQVYQKCVLHLFLYSDPHVKFFCLQVLEYHARHRHICSSDDDILTLRKFLLLWIQPSEQVILVSIDCWKWKVNTHLLVQVVEEETFVRNKMAQVYALVFIVDYPSKAS